FPILFGETLDGDLMEITLKTRIKRATQIRPSIRARPPSRYVSGKDLYRDSCMVMEADGTNTMKRRKRISYGDASSSHFTSLLIHTQQIRGLKMIRVELDAWITGIGMVKRIISSPA
ncbi:hypothetical protein Tco_1478521, partial [Tanacetum coccineum]